MAINIYKGNYKLMMALPLILYVVFAILIFVYPTVPLGTDLTGGTRMVIRADQAIDSAKLDALLNQSFELKELKVSSVSSVAGNGAIIEFQEFTPLAEADRLISNARTNYQVNESLAKEDLAKANAIISTLIEVPRDQPQEIKSLIDFSVEYHSRAKAEFENKVVSIIKTNFGLIEEPKVQVAEIAPLLSKEFWNNAIFIILMSFVGITLVVFISFRELLPSVAIIAAALFDILCAVALMALFKIPLSLATIPALLALVGYSIDTDILLTSRLLKRKEDSPADRSMEALWTGVTMTSTAIAALGVMSILGYLTQLIIVWQIGLIMLFGQLGDLIATWMFNAPLLLWYAEKKEKKSN